MKKFMLGSLTTIVMIVVFGFIIEKNDSTIPEKEWIIAPRFLTLQDGITKEEARKWMENEYLPLYRYYSGWNAMLGEPLRSGGWGTPNNKAKEKGDFVLFYIFDTQKTRDHYFPLDGSWSAEVLNVLEKHQSTWDKFFGTYFIQDKYQNEAYLMFASAK